MRELKEHQFCECDEIICEYRGQLSNEMRPYYLKSEADKVIADKDEKIDELEERIDELQKATDSAWSKVNVMYDELRHQKYKRCLGKAEWCESKVYHIRRTPLCDMSEHEYWQYENDFWQKWEKRWLELAEKFK